MNKFFTKKEADIIINLLKSDDIYNKKLGMDLIFTHKRYKSFLKLIIIRYPKAMKREYYNISTKYSFKQAVYIYNNKIKDFDWDYLEYRNMFFKFFIDFVKKRTK